MKKIFIMWFSLFLSAYAVDIGLSEDVAQEANITQLPQDMNSVRVFGSNLFSGKFANIRQYRFNPEYRINIGDKISVKFWGAYDAELVLQVDNQGNVFIPKVGVVHLLGIKASELTLKIQEGVKKVFKENVFVYANVMNYQPVTVFVAGSVNKPGLYEGLSSDSIIQYLDKAQGIKLKDGSFRRIAIKRNGKIVANVDLYNFLLGGDLSLFQFQNGDVIYVDGLHNYIFVKGDVKRDFRFEILRDAVTLKDVKKLAIPSESVTDVVIYHWGKDNKLTTKKVSIDANNEKIFKGDEIEFLSDHNAYQVSVTIEGEVAGTHTLVLPKGSSLQDLLNKLRFSPLANKDAVQIYRKSVAKLQKQLIESQLKDLESRVLAASSITRDGAIIKKEEAENILKFVARARQVEPKGKIVLNEKSDLSKVILENEDTIYIPKKSSIVTVQGEVKIPGAQTYVKGKDIDDYIESVGGFNDRADLSSVLIVRQNGRVLTYDADWWFEVKPEVKPGDSILVLGKPGSENLQITKDITRILYEIAISTGVVIGLF